MSTELTKAAAERLDKIEGWLKAYRHSLVSYDRAHVAELQNERIHIIKGDWKEKKMTTELTKAAAVMGRKGGLARARNLSKEQIAEISRKAGLASAEKRRQQTETQNDDRHGDSANN